MTLYMTFSTVADADAEPVLAEASLPADDETLAEIAEDAGLASIDDPIRTYDLRIADLSQLGPFIELASLREANILATRLTQLHDQEVAEVEAFAVQQRGNNRILGGDELINLTYQLESCVRVPGITNVTELGRYIIQNDMDNEISGLSDKTMTHISPASVGRNWLSENKGVFTWFGYTEQLEKPENLPHPYVRTVRGLDLFPDDRVISLALTERQWQIVGDALRTWDAPTVMQDAVNTIRTQLQTALKEQAMDAAPQQPTLGL